MLSFSEAVADESSIVERSFAKRELGLIERSGCKNVTCSRDFTYIIFGELESFLRVNGQGYAQALLRLQNCIPAALQRPRQRSLNIGLDGLLAPWKSCMCSEQCDKLEAHNCVCFACGDIAAPTASKHWLAIVLS